VRRFIDSPNHLEWDGDNNRYVPAHSQLQFDPEMSTQWSEHLSRVHQLGPEVILADAPNYSLVGEWSVDAVRKLAFRVANTPDPDGDGPLNCSHASVYWPLASIVPPKTEPSPSKRKKLRNDLNREMTWAFGEISTPPPDGS
jgi:hypothetical protein